MKRFAAVSLLVLGALFLLDGTILAQCSMCVSALESSAEGQAIAGSFRKGIILLLAAPYALVGTFGYLVLKAYRNNGEKRGQ